MDRGELCWSPTGNGPSRILWGASDILRDPLPPPLASPRGDESQKTEKGYPMKGERRARFLCAECKRETNHDVVVKEEKTESTEEFTLWSEWAVVRCAGCETMSFAERTWFSEDRDPGTGQIRPNVTLYPKRNENSLQIKNYPSVPQKLRRIYSEIIECFNSDCLTLCAAGLRALVEGMCADKKVGGVSTSYTKKDGTLGTRRKRDLEGKIDGLVENKFLTESHAAILHKHRFLGNRAVHELESPSSESLSAAIGILELTLENLYELSKMAKRMKKRA